MTALQEISTGRTSSVRVARYLLSFPPEAHQYKKFGKHGERLHRSDLTSTKQHVRFYPKTKGEDQPDYKTLHDQTDIHKPRNRKKNFWKPVRDLGY